MEKRIQKQIISIIDDVDDMTIATVRSDGFPQATTVSYVNDGLTIYFMTTDDAQKVRNIEMNNRISLTINRHYKSWNEIESISLGGLAIRVSDPKEQEKVGTLLLKKFPQAAQYEPNVDIGLAVYRIEPKVISLLDYKISFGHTKLIEF